MNIIVVKYFLFLVNPFLPFGLSIRYSNKKHVEITCHGHLGEGEDEGGCVRLYHPDVVHRHVRHRVQEGHPTLNIED